MMTRLSRTGVVLMLFVMGCASTSSPSRFGSLSSFGKRKSKDSHEQLASAKQNRGSGSADTFASPDVTRGAAADASPDSAQSLEQSLAIGRAALENRRLQEAKLHFEQALKQQPKHVKAHHQLGIVFDQLGEFDAAREHYLVALEGDPSDPDILSDIGYSNFLQNRFDESEKYLLQAVRHHPAHRRALNNLGLLYAKKGDYDKSLSSFREVSTENQAQAIIAKLFPNGRPQGGSASEPFDPNEWAKNKSLQLAESSASPMPAVPNTLSRNDSRFDRNEPAMPAGYAQNANSYPSTASQQISALQAPTPSAPNLAGAAQWPEVPRAVYPATPMSEPAGPAISGTSPWGDARNSWTAPEESGNLYRGNDQNHYPGTNVSDAQINRAFADIDAHTTAGADQQGGRIGQSVGSPVPARRANDNLWGAEPGPAQFASTPGRISPRQPDRPDVNPLDSMPLWKTGDATNENSVYNASGEWPANDDPSAPIQQLGNVQSDRSGRADSLPPQWPYSPQAAAQPSPANVNGPRGEMGPAARYDTMPASPAMQSSGPNGNSVETATQTAARLGMAAGPGRMFPMYAMPGSSGMRSMPSGPRDPASNRNQWPTTSGQGYPDVSRYPSAAGVQRSVPASNLAMPGSYQPYQQTSSATTGNNSDVYTADWPSPAPVGGSPTPYDTGDGASRSAYGQQWGDYPPSTDSVTIIPNTVRQPMGDSPISRSGYDRSPSMRHDAADTTWPDQYRQSQPQPPYGRTAPLSPTGTSSGSGQYNPWPQ